VEEGHLPIPRSGWMTAILSRFVLVPDEAPATFPAAVIFSDPAVEFPIRDYTLTRREPRPKGSSQVLFGTSVFGIALLHLELLCSKTPWWGNSSGVLVVFGKIGARGGRGVQGTSTDGRESVQGRGGGSTRRTSREGRRPGKLRCGVPRS
jgi:hypothetical protein